MHVRSTLTVGGRRVDFGHTSDTLPHDLLWKCWDVCGETGCDPTQVIYVSGYGIQCQGNYPNWDGRNVLINAAGEAVSRATKPENYKVKVCGPEGGCEPKPGRPCPKTDCEWLPATRITAPNYMEIIVYVGNPESQQARFSYTIVQGGSGDNCDDWKKFIGILQIPISFIPEVGGALGAAASAGLTFACG
jgi:hypothetical protein